MSEHNLSRETAKELDRLVERVARKSGYSGGEETYKEHLQRKLEQKLDKAKRTLDHYRHKFSLRSTNQDFADEIKTYLSDGIADLMAEGMSEAEALRVTKEKFDEAELAGSFDEFMNEFDDFGLEQWQKQNQLWYMRHGESVGLFYAGFMMLGMVFGALIGFLTSGGVPAFLPQGGWVYTIIGLAVGLFTGLGLGMLSNAIIVAIKRK